jgi:hypothetical protein
MPLNPTPVTRTRLSIAYSIYITAYDGKRHKVGTFRKLSTSENRNVNAVFSIDSDLSGQPYETIPEIAKDKSLTYEALTLYTQNLMEAIADKQQRIESLVDFNIPFDIEVIITAPDGSTKSKKYVSCWLTSYDESVDIGSLIVSASGKIIYERIDYPLT